MNFYKEELNDHFKNPRNKAKLEKPDFATGEYNPSCGDSIELEGIIKDNVLVKLVFMGKGCVISQASASMLTEAVINKNLDEIAALNNTFMNNLIGIELGPTRLKCMLLAFEALQKGITEYKAGDEQGE